MYPYGYFDYKMIVKGVENAAKELGGCISAVLHLSSQGFFLDCARGMAVANKTK